jgi:hypothetical protein
MPEPKQTLDSYPQYKHFEATARLFGLRRNLDLFQDKVALLDNLNCNCIHLSLSSTERSQTLKVAPHIIKIYKEDYFSENQLDSEACAAICGEVERYCSWLRMASIMLLSRRVKANSSLEKVFCDFALVAKVEIPNESLIRFVNQWSRRPLREAVRKACERAVRSVRSTS